MKDATDDGVLERLIAGSGVKNELGLAAFLGISGQSIYNAKKKRKIPPLWGVEVAKTFGVSLDWIFFGRGPMRPGEDACVSTPQPEQAQTTPCARCEKLEAKLEKVENQRDELIEENRRLWKENAEIRERAARLDEQLNKPGTPRFSSQASTAS